MAIAGNRDAFYLSEKGPPVHVNSSEGKQHSSYATDLHWREQNALPVPR